MRVLLVEDDASTAKSIELMLRSQAYVCDGTQLGEDALEIAKLYDYDIILLDLMLPDMHGFEVLSRLRLAKVRTPIMIVSARAEADARIKALSIGADDFLTKPFDKRELMARIQAIVRRSKGHFDSVIQIGKLKVNLERHTVMVDAQPLHLTRKEYAVLELLALRSGAVQTKDALMNHLYGGDNEPGFKVVDVFVCKLRKKLSAACGENYIHTDWGRGYVLRAPNVAKGAEQAQAA